MNDGLEKHRVRLGSVGEDTKNYQQYLHRIFFGCNAPVKYRANINERVKVKLDKNIVAYASHKLHSVLYDARFRYLEKDYIANRYFNNKYRAIFTARNSAVRLLYNMVLYYISYYINENNEFKSDAHFYSSMMYNLYTNIDTIAYRIYKLPLTNSRDEKYKISAKQHYYVLESMDSIINEMLVQIVWASGDIT